MDGQNPLSCLGKIDVCTAKPVRRPIIGQTVGNAIAGGIESQPQGQSAQNGSQNPLQALWNGIEHVGGAIVGGVEQVGGAIINGVEQVGGAIINGVETAGNAVITGVETVGSDIANGINSILSPVQQADQDVGGPHGRWPTIQPKDASIGSSFGDGRGTISYNGITSDHLSGNQLVTQKLVDTTQSILSEDTDINSANITATTNGHANEPYGDHANGDAVDVNIVNGIHISNSGPGLEVAKELKDDAMSDPNVRYVEGPGGDFARATPNSPWVPAPPLATMNSHVHWSVFPVKATTK